MLTFCLPLGLNLGSCYHCGKRFSSNVVKRKHQKTCQELQVPSKPASKFCIGKQCLVCNLMFSTELQLKKHLNSSHGRIKESTEKNAPKIEPPKPCKFCHESTEKKQQLETTEKSLIIEENHANQKKESESEIPLVIGETFVKVEDAFEIDVVDECTSFIEGNYSDNDDFFEEQDNLIKDLKKEPDHSFSDGSDHLSNDAKEDDHCINDESDHCSNDAKEEYQNISDAKEHDYDYNDHFFNHGRVDAKKDDHKISDAKENDN